MVEATRAQPARSVGIVGGTGKLGAALAVRLASAGHTVVIGSRVAARAADVSAALAGEVPTGAGVISGADNAEACTVDGAVFIAVPYDGLDDIVGGLAGRIGDRTVVSTVVPVGFVKGEGYAAIDVPAGSACQQVAALLPSARVVGALHTLSHVALRDLGTSVDSDVILTGDDQAAKATVARLLAAIDGLRLVDGGALRNSRFVEQLTVLLLSINRRYRRRTGLRITDLDDHLLADWDMAAG
jgi:hypothetical protein